MYDIIAVVIVSYLCQFGYVSSQGCVESERSPTNPANAQCDVSFFDLQLKPFDPCICCTETGIPDDNPPDECRNADIPTDNKTDLLGTLTCNENFDCCSCSSLICSDCVKVECSGDSACIGVRPIIVDGNCDLAGAIMACNGDVSCFRTEIEGECVTSFDCNGDNSCGQSLINLNLNTPVPSTLTPINFVFNGDRSVPFSTINARNVAAFTCGGDNSCNETNIILECRSNGVDVGCPIKGDGDNSAPNSKWSVMNSNLVSCSGDGSCENSMFNITCVSRGCDTTINGPFGAANAMFIIDHAKLVTCTGESACLASIFDIICIINSGMGCEVSVGSPNGARHAVWNIQNAKLLTCNGAYSCGDGTYIFDCVEGTGCSIMCSGACPNSEFIFTFSNGVTCNGIILGPVPGGPIIGSCENSVFKLNSNIGGALDCGGDQGCKNAEFSDTFGGPIDNVMEVRCNARASCEFATFNVSPESTIHKLTCGGTESCMDLAYTLTTGIDGIQGVFCNAMNACQHANVTIIKTGENPFSVSQYSCGGQEACLNSIIDVESESDISLDIVSCSGLNACKDASLNIDLLNPGKFVTLNLNCNAIDSCAGFTITISENGVVLGPEIMDVFNINIICPPQTCTGATVNGVPFTSFN